MVKDDASWRERWWVRGQRLWHFGTPVPGGTAVDERRRITLNEADEEWLRQYDSMDDISDRDRHCRKDYLLAIYGQLYGEMHAREQNDRQWVTWTFSILTAAALLGIQIKKSENLRAVIIVCVAITMFAVLATFSIWDSTSGRKGVMKSIDRIHQIMGFFTKGYYYPSSSLLRPSWFGWGFYRAATHERFARACIAAMWLMVVLDVGVLLW